MILLSLTLHNFMSYAEATLDLSSTPIVCLTGSNGAGKSALLDALTWTLWETARSSSDEMIRLGEKEMWVDLTFEHEGEQYRVRRSRQKVSAKAGSKMMSKGTLDFQIFNSQKHLVQAGAIEREQSFNNGNWRSLTGTSVRQTQKQITVLLRMDFDTFVNSAYLRQGKADEFTTRPPSERKQILSDILNLAYFDRLQEKAKERARQLKVEVEVLARRLHNLPELTDNFERVTKELGETRLKLASADSQLNLLEAEEDRVAKEIAKISIAQERLKIGEEHAENLVSDLQGLTAQHKFYLDDIEKLAKVLSRTAEIEVAVVLFDSHKSQVETLDRQAFEVQELSAQKMSLQHHLATMRAKLEVELTSAADKAKDLENKTEQLIKDDFEKEKITLAYTHYKRCVADEAELASRQETFARMTNRANDLATQIRESKIRLESDLYQKQQALVEHEVILRSEINLQDQKSALENEILNLDQLEMEFRLIEETGITIKTRIEAKANKIESIKHQQIEKTIKIEELHTHSDSDTCPLCSAHIVDRAAVVDRYLQEIETLEREISTEAAAIEDLGGQRQGLRKRYSEIRQILERRQYLDKQIGQFNEKIMAIERVRDSQKKIELDTVALELRLKNDNFAQLERESLIGVKAELHKLEFDPMAYANIQSQLRMQRHIEVRYHQMHRDLIELENISLVLPSLQAQVKHLGDELSSESYGQIERSSLAELMQKITSINYDRALHIQLKEKLASLLPLAELKRELKTAQLEKPRLELCLQLCSEQLMLKKEQLQTFYSEREVLQSSLNYLPELESQAEKLKPLVNLSRDNKEQMTKAEAVLESECRHLARSSDELKSAQSNLQILNDELEDHYFLAEACGKKGIQAVIIEHAIPEIETEANRILSRLTENKMHVAFITQQKNKSGSMIETLELVIGDEIGTRNYELFSGGEAFKVNFAVRVALSRLLARRSGAKLETLIVDEGFGSQDEVSRERLVKAIQAIQNEFARIIVITHMSDIKEMFVAQINITKTHGSSQLQIMY